MKKKEQEIIKILLNRVYDYLKAQKDFSFKMSCQYHIEMTKILSRQKLSKGVWSWSIDMYELECLFLKQKKEFREELKKKYNFINSFYRKLMEQQKKAVLETNVIENFLDDLIKKNKNFIDFENNTQERDVLKKAFIHTLESRKWTQEEKEECDASDWTLCYSLIDFKKDGTISCFLYNTGDRDVFYVYLINKNPFFYGNIDL